MGIWHPLRAIVCKYGESDDRSGNSDFLLLRQKDHIFCELLESSKYRSINQNGRWNLRKIAHFQQATTERKEFALISSFSPSFVIYNLVIFLG